MDTYPPEYLAFEILVHVTEVILVVGIGLTIYFIRRTNKQKKLEMAKKSED
jgi:hypothetical protein